MNKILTEAVRLFEGIFIGKVLHFPTFDITLNMGDPGYFDFIIPTTSIEKFDWGEAKNIIDQHSVNQIKLHWYLSGQNHQNFIDKLISGGGFEQEIEACMFNVQKRPFLLPVAHRLETLDTTNITQFMDIANTCFPNYSNNLDFANQFCRLEAENSTRTTQCHNSFLVIDNQKVAIGCMVYSPVLNLGYFHNFATLPQHRRLGYFLLLKQELMNIAIEAGVNRFFAINALDSNSHKANISQGWHQVDNFHFLRKQERANQR